MQKFKELYNRKKFDFGEYEFPIMPPLKNGNHKRGKIKDYEAIEIYKYLLPYLTNSHKLNIQMNYISDKYNVYKCIVIKIMEGKAYINVLRTALNPSHNTDFNYN